MPRRCARTSGSGGGSSRVKATTAAATRQQQTRLATTTTTAAHSPSATGPRTRLPVLQNVVRRALTMPLTTTATATTSGGVSASPYKLYPHPPPAVPLPSATTSTTTAAATTPVVADRSNVSSSSSSSNEHHSAVLYRDEQCVLVNDAYPKSAVHCLVLPLDLSLVSLDSLTAQHVPLLRHCVSVADAYVRFLKATAPSLYGRRRFITGFHALPSLPMLHMHLLTMDLDSPCLKTKRHYNSFATFFFLTTEKVIADLERHGVVTLHRNVATMRQLEAQAMQCLWCGAALANVPTMKAHIRTCAANRALE